jgi:hypothetical protein
MDAESIDTAIREIKEAQRELESQRAAGENAAAATIRQQITEMESQRAAGEAKHVRAEADKNKGAFERINNLRYMKSDIETDIMHMEQDRREHENEIYKLNRLRENLLKEYQKADSEEWSGTEICPTCKRPLPQEQIAAAKEAFNIAKAERLEEINQRGMKECSSAMIKAEQEEIAKLDAKIAAQKEKKAEVEQNLAAAERATLATVEYSTTEEYKGYTEQIEALQAKLKDMKAAAAEADMVLIGKIRKLDADLEMEMSKKTALEFAARQDERIAELENQEKELAAKYEQIQKGIYLCELYTRKKASLLDEKINNRFKTLRFRLFIEQQNGGTADDCEALVPCASGMVPFKSANNAARINAGLEVIDTLAKYYGVELPVFIDNAESVTRIQHTAAQVIRLVVSEADKKLRFEKGEN